MKPKINFPEPWIEAFIWERLTKVGVRTTRASYRTMHGLKIDREKAIAILEDLHALGALAPIKENIQ